MSHVKRRPSKHPGRIVKQKKKRGKLSKTARNLLLFAFVMIIVIFSAAAAGLIFFFA